MSKYDDGETDLGSCLKGIYREFLEACVTWIFIMLHLFIRRETTGFRTHKYTRTLICIQTKAKQRKSTNKVSHKYLFFGEWNRYSVEVKTHTLLQLLQNVAVGLIVLGK